MAQTPELILSLDLGTTAIKVGLFSASGNLEHGALREQQLIFPSPDRAEQSLPATWQLLCDAVQEVASLVDSERIAVISLANQRGSVVPMNEQGEPIGNLIVWMDSRGLEQVERLEKLIGSEAYYKTSGHPIVPITGVSKVLWLQQQASELWQQAASVGPPQTALLHWLGSEQAYVDFSSGSYLFPNDIREKQWSDEIAESLEFPLEKLPKLVPATEIVGELSQKAGEQLGLPSGIPIVAGGGDGQCAAAGTGVVMPGNVMVNIGTATGVQVYLSEPSFDPSHTLNCASHVVKDAWEMEGHTQASGIVFRWFRDEFGGVERLIDRQSSHDAYDLLVDQADQAPPGSDDLIFLPTFNGSTAPFVDPFARGALIGLKLSHKRAHIIRAILEGISLEIRWMLDAIAEVGVPVEEIRIAGGGSKNALWNQIHAAVFNRSIRTVENPDAALVGGAMCAAVAMGYQADFRAAAQAFVKLGPEIEPKVADEPIYQEAYERYVQTFKLLSGGNAFRS